MGGTWVEEEAPTNQADTGLDASWIQSLIVKNALLCTTVFMPYRNYIICFISHSWQMAWPGFKLELMWFQISWFFINIIQVQWDRDEETFTGTI